MSYLLQYSQLGRRYGNHWALESASDVLKPGEVVALAGANGSGKSTLLLVLAKILQPHRGTVAFFENARAHLVSHLPMAYVQLTVVENLRWSLSLSQNSLAMQTALGYWQLEALQHKPVNSLSRGQLQRFLLARAMLSDDKILLLDEPFTGLDESGERLLAEFIGLQARSGKAILFSEHDARRAKRIATRVLQMKDGRCQA